ncbi:hypothetical protein C8R44DRAFT_780990 [Mycena epipterygia]|nr:hypothetical protein C8R44DRAFT_780990 [Mycena epipterygia]
MIIPHDQPKSVLSESSKPEATVTDIDIPPPAYETRPADGLGAPPHIKPANYISIRRRMGELNDTFVLDPTLRVSTSMRPRNDKMHLSLSALMGEVSAVVYVVGSGALPSDRTCMEVYSFLGSTRLELHAPEPRARICVNVSARMGESNLFLPRSFRGPLRISVALGEVEMSAALQAATTTFGDGRMFVGEWTQADMEEGVWTGDEAVVDSKLGTVHVGYEDDVKKPS